MTEIEIKNKLDPLLKDLATHRTLKNAEILISELMKMLEIETGERKLLNIAKVDNEIHRFQPAPSFLKQAAAYEIPNNKNNIIDLKLYWLRKTTKTNLSWVVGLTPNFEDSAANDFENFGIDFVVPEVGDSLIILLSQQYKIRSLEIKDHITSTQAEIFKAWSSINTSVSTTDNSLIKSMFHSKLWDSFNFEPINKKFYLDLVESFDLLVHHLEAKFGKKQSVMFTTRLIGRLLFVWFLKKKNLINTNINYFEINDYENQNDFYNNKLEILFFEVLNQEISQRKTEDKLTPYLNGGLFDTNITDFYKDHNLTFPNGFFNHLFSILNKYNFTVDESSPEFQHVAIDPEMLGRIFESLLAEQIDDSTGDNKKKSTGAFYTPREIVSYICEESLIEFLKSKVPFTPDRDRRIEELLRLPEAIFRDQDSNKRRDWKPYSESIINALEGTSDQPPITVLDPAVGSGAFPMGMLHLLVKVFSRLDVKYEKNIADLKRKILSKSLYGVDIEQTAIEICRLRAWLSIIVDINETEIIEPLPNLDFKFACANALISLEDEKQQTFFTDLNLKDKLMKIRDEYFDSNNKSKKIKLQNEYNKLTHNEDLFDSKKTKQLKSYMPFDVSASSDFYDPKLHHGVEFFDLVIGNPPYVQIQKFSKQAFQKDLENSNYETFAKYGDLYCLFYEKALKLCKKYGTVGFITSNKWMKSGYGEKLRSFFIKNNPKLLINLGSNIFSSAAVDTNILIIQNSPIKTEFYGVVIDNEKNKADNIYEIVSKKRVLLKNLTSESWSIGSSEDQDLKSKIQNAGVTLKDLNIKICRGIVTGLNEAFIIDQEKYDSLIKEDSKNVEILKPILRGRDLFKYKNNYKSLGLYVILVKFNDYKKLKLLYPSVHSHLLNFELKLKSRAQCKGTRSGRSVSQDYEGQHHWLELDNNLNEDYLNLFKNEKIAWSDISSEPNFSIINSEIYLNNTAYIISTDTHIKFITAVLNSKVLKWYFPKIATDLGNNGVRYFKQFVELLPIPNITADNQFLIGKIEELVERIHEKLNANADASVSDLEIEIDALVYSLFKLSPEDISNIESI